ncbi:acyl-CoA carboxylase subunit beta [Ohessyouella blattaphilus]|uniref:acyl-CoA carboxylase subunit beta n=1 Tax=Ohessyouella blattaphilus TaxID=2949333 RepID=UPI003EBD78AA
MEVQTMSNTAESRIKSLLDDGSFVEIGGSVMARATDFNIQANSGAGDGVKCGYGVIDGNLVYVYSQDASVLGGSVGEMHAKKIANLYDMAMKMGAPVIGLVDSAGMRLQESTDALEAFGTVYRKQALASGVIPQLTAVFGKCGGGLAVLAGLADFTFMEGEKGKLFINSPNALPGNEIGKEDTSSAEFQAENTGVVDAVGTEAEVLGSIRSLVAMLPINNEEEAALSESTDDLNRVIANLEASKEDGALAASLLSDNNMFFETKKAYAKDMVTGFIKLNGMTVGVVANRSKIYNEQGEVAEEFDAALSSKGAKKAASFVEFCDAFNIPVLTLTNVNGFKASKCSEKTLAKAVAKLTYAFANASVPKVNVIVGKAFGSAYVAMNSKSLGADLVFAWTNAKVGTMEADMAAKVMYPEASSEDLKEKAKEYEALQDNVEAAARRGYVDQVIEAADTRKYVISAFEMLLTKREDRPYKKHGTV